MEQFDYKQRNAKFVVLPNESWTMRTLKFEGKFIAGLNEMISDILKSIGSDISVCEIGCYNGESSILFALHFDDVLCVDPWMNGYDDEHDAASIQYDMSFVKENFNFITRNFKNISIIEDTGYNFLNCLEENEIFDVIYIDGCHTYDILKQEIQLAKDKTIFLCGHDYNNAFPAIKQVLEEEFGKDLKIKVYRDSSWLIDTREL